MNKTKKMEEFKEFEQLYDKNVRSMRRLEQEIHAMRLKLDL